MNKKSFLLFLSIFFISCTPADYCDTINVEIKKCQTSVHKFLNAKNYKSSDYNKLTDQLISSENKIKKLGYFRDEKELFDTALALLNFYKLSLHELNENNIKNHSDFLLNFEEIEQILISAFRQANYKFINKFDLIQTQL